MDAKIENERSDVEIEARIGDPMCRGILLPMVLRLCKQVMGHNRSPEVKKEAIGRVCAMWVERIDRRGIPLAHWAANRHRIEPWQTAKDLWYIVLTSRVPEVVRELDEDFYWESWAKMGCHFTMRYVLSSRIDDLAMQAWQDSACKS